ncbi:MAG: leucine-rich repeat protein [Clostridiales bacterium]|nr:leucine-rich repeat protein [Clostridiales bacterium]
MKRSLKRLTALVLALSMTLSLLSATAWAAETETLDESTAEIVAENDDEIVLDLTENAADEDEEPPAEETPTEVVAIDETAEETTEEAAPAGDESAAEGEETDDEADVAVSAQATTASGTCGTNLTWTLSSAGVLTISGSGAMTSWSSDSSVPWYSYRESIKSVSIGSSVTSISGYAFSGCTNLTSVSIGSGVTSIGSYAFDNCTSLASVTIPSSVTSISSFAFYSCTSLTAFTVNSSNTTYCSSSGVLFNKAKTSLIAYPAGKTSTSYTIPSTVTSIGNCAFRSCTSLTSVTIPSSVTSIGVCAFAGCTSLTSVTIPSSVTSIGSSAFRVCTSLASVTISSSVTSTAIKSYAFYDCTSLTSVVIPSGVTSIGTEAFGYTSSAMVSGFTLYGYSGSAAETYTSSNSITFVTLPLSAPTLSLSITSSGVKATCGSVSNATGYEVQSSTSSSFSPYAGSIDTSTSKSFTGLTSGTTYYFRARAYVTVGGTKYYGSYSSTKSTYYLSAPSSFTGSAVSSGISLSWGSVTGATGYKVYRSTSSSGTYSLKTTTNSTSYTDTSVSRGNTYYYKVYAYYGSYTSAAVSTSISYPLLTMSVTKSNYSGTYDGSSHTFTLKVSGPSSYTIYYSSSTELTSSNYSSSGGTTKPTCTNAGTTTVYYYVKDNTGNYNDASGSATIKISKANQTLTASAAATSIYAGKSTTITAKTTGDGAISYSSSNASIATVSSAGKVTGKKPGTVTITVKAASTTNYNAASKTISITVQLNKTTISSLTNTSKGITVKWSKVTGASGYYVYRKTSGGSYSKIKTITSGSTVSYTDTAVKSKNGTTYVYAVRAYFGSTLGSYTDKTTVRVTAVSVSSAKNSAKKTITVKWKKNAKASGYQLYISPTSDFSSGTKQVYYTGTSYKITGLTKGKTYYVKVRAYKTVSGTKYYSAWSSSKKVKISK